MGAGKSTVGRALAKRLGWAFIDTDHEVEALTGVRIPIIFDIEGELGFRKREAQIIAESTLREHLVLGTGGGAILDPDNRQLLRTRGHVVYLNASPEELYNRTRHDKKRPLLQTDDPRQRLYELTEQRHSLYLETAHTVVETGRQPIHDVVETVVKALGLTAHSPCGGG